MGPGGVEVRGGGIVVGVGVTLVDGGGGWLAVVVVGCWRD